MFTTDCIVNCDQLNVSQCRVGCDNHRHSDRNFGSLQRGHRGCRSRYCATIGNLSQDMSCTILFEQKDLFEEKELEYGSNNTLLFNRAVP